MRDYSNTSILKEEEDAKNLKNKMFPNISLPNQEGNLLRLHRLDTFRIVFYFYPMTGRPDKPLPENWNNIPGAKGCTIQTCLFRENYYDIINLNAVPISPIDSVGAGDAFNTGFIYASCCGKDIEESLDIGNQVAAFKLLGSGARHLPTKELLDDFNKKYQIN